MGGTKTTKCAKFFLFWLSKAKAKTKYMNENNINDDDDDFNVVINEPIVVV